VKRVLIVVGVLVFVVGVVAIAAVGAFVVAVDRDTTYPAQAVRVIVPQGSSMSQIAALLVDRGVIGNALSFRLLAKLRHDEGDLRAGEYVFGPHQSQNAVLGQLLGGGAQVAVWVTIPEGFTAREIAQRLQDAGVGSADEFAGAFMRDTIVVDGTRTKNLEGFLFPSTYLIPAQATPDQVEAILTGQFFKELPVDALARAKALGLTVPQVITVASLIEREAKSDSERPIMAGVYYNRLRLRMPLQVDATIEYALPEHKDALSFADLRIDSPYNSYLHEGLPPTPIANPGEPSILAAFHPERTTYLYYVYMGNGHHAFASTLAEHNANVAKYEK
jgi:UPF0755 protein